jgi:hypothetical protein
MSSNVGLSTPRGSGTSGYVQRNAAFMKPRNSGYGAPYPPISGANGFANDASRSFKQRQPDKQILEHDRRRAVEVRVMEERERLEEESERIEEDGGKGEGKGKGLSEEEIEERCEALRARLLREMEEEEKRKGDAGAGERDEGRERRGWKRGPRDRERERDLPPRERRQFKSYQVHELAEAKIEETERFKKALGIREDTATGEISSGRKDKDNEGRKRERERY